MEKPPFQFGLKYVFAVVTVVAVLLATLVTIPELLGGFIISLVALAVGSALSAVVSAGQSWKD